MIEKALDYWFRYPGYLMEEAFVSGNPVYVLLKNVIPMLEGSVAGLTLHKYVGLDVQEAISIGVIGVAIARNIQGRRFVHNNIERLEGRMRRRD